MSPVLRLDGWRDGSVVYMLGLIENAAVVVPVTSVQFSSAALAPQHLGDVVPGGSL